ncbi:Dual oxidase 1 [Seminavis robusta]|uniref:Dual oxidase 1 n=1 Tax=Seminavis robusta TaxID=568900 RepID=A0A9N8HAW7_9STRA|nr:Dual oxidase 1 [Seminavis robusta]|eukprot:Sro162_g072870.1 Dual oxidase 1 (1611) ;mRNA; f:52664-57772
MLPNSSMLPSLRNRLLLCLLVLGLIGSGGSAREGTDDDGLNEDARNATGSKLSIPHPVIVDDDTKNGSLSWYYSYDGRGNNLERPAWGAVHTTRVRILPNTTTTSIDQTLPSARRIMEELFRQAPAKPDRVSNHLLLEFGHIVALDLVRLAHQGVNQSEPFPVPCDGNLQDWVFCPVTQQRYSQMDFWRAPHETLTSKRRATINTQTTYLDLSHLYGTNQEETEMVRAFQGGKLLLHKSDGLPHGRLREHFQTKSIGFYVWMVILMRFHNLVAEQLAASDDSNTTTTRLQQDDDEELFQRARQYTIAVYQSIVEQKYIPTLLGRQLEPYQGYNPQINPSVDEFFAAVAFRYGHSSTSALVRMLDENWKPLSKDPLFLRDVLGKSSDMVQQQIGTIKVFLRGLTVQPTKATDASIVDDLNLWGTAATSVVDIQRGRDVGIPPYNQVRHAMGLPRMTSIEELTQNETIVTNALQSLYDNDIDQVDAYVGALVEPPLNVDDFMGPLFTISILDQLTRVRDGDRLWFKNIYAREDYEVFPTVADLVRLTCRMDDFPEDAFTTFVPMGPTTTTATATATGDDDETCGSASTQLYLLSGDFTLGWVVEQPTVAERQLDSTMRDTIDVTLSLNMPMDEPGYLGIGWRSIMMYGSEMWFCTINENVFDDEGTEFCAANQHDNNSLNISQPALFACCLAMGPQHAEPVCSSVGDPVHYELEVVDWCLTSDTSSVTIRAPVCPDELDDSTISDETASDGVSCFRLNSEEDGTMDFIVAFNPNSMSRTHGYMRRTSAQVDLRAGILTQSEANVADSGLVATHGLFMLVGWMVAAPVSVFIVRYLKTKTWRIAAHVSLMGIVGSLMVPLLIGVEASVGASEKTQEHSVVGLSIMMVWFLIAFAGRIRILKLEGRRIGRKLGDFSLFLHRYGGVAMVLCSWWNCYTGLVRIGPEDSYVQAVVFSSIPMGYNIPVFGFIRKYIFFPYVAMVCIVFVVAEARRYRMNGSLHVEKMYGIVDGKTSLWDDFPTDELEKMTMENFLELTRQGAALCIVDGCVIDLADFTEFHPGGRHLLRFARGSDITEEFVGLRDVDGSSHVHSQAAHEALKTLVKAVLVICTGTDGNLDGMVPLSGSSRSLLGPRKSFANTTKNPCLLPVFRRGRIVDLKCLTPSIEITDCCKPVILLRLALPRIGLDERTKQLLPLPSCVFTFRGLDDNGSTVERQYTPVSLEAHEEVSCASVTANEGVIDFIISLVPSGKMSRILLDMSKGKLLLVQGPTVCPSLVQTFQDARWESIVMIAAGTGIAPMLQVIDYLLVESEERVRSPATGKPVRMFLMWIMKGPEYNYGKQLGLDRRVQHSRGRFKYTVVYSSSSGNNNKLGPLAKDGPPASRKSIGHSPDWNFRSLLQKSWPSFAPKDKRKIKGLVLGNCTGFSSKTLIGMDFGDDDSSCTRIGELTQDIWSGPPQCHARHYDKDLLHELLESLPCQIREFEANPAAVSNGDQRWVEVSGSGVWVPAKEVNENHNQSVEEGRSSATQPVLVSQGGNEGATMSNHAAPARPGESYLEGTTVDVDDDAVCSLESNLLVVVSGSPTFEYQTQVALRELGVTSDRMVTFHRASSHTL